MTLTNTEVLEPVAAVDAADTHPLVVRIREYVDTVLRPAALRTDRDGVDRARIDELAGLGLLNHLSSPRWGGADVDRATDRRLHELIAGGCFNTWLVWAQHASLNGRLSALERHGDPGSDLVRRALRGEILLGAGVSDVRRFPDKYVHASRVEGGWVFDGTISWVSGWGLNAAITVGAVEPTTEQVVTALVTVGDSTTSDAPLRLAAVGGGRTERVRLTRTFVPAEHVLTIQPLEQARYEDIGVASDARSHHFGLAETVLTELEHSADEPARRVAATWRPRVADIRRTAYALADESAERGGGPHRIDERLATKVASGEALATLTRALVISRTGRGLADDDTAQLHARSALFVLVQGQTAAVRHAQLDQLAR